MRHILSRRAFGTHYPKSKDLSSAITFKSQDLVTNLKTTRSELPPFDPKTLSFGKYSSDHMLTIDYTKDMGWSKPHIAPFAPLSIHPFSSAIHYGLQCFEGLKAYKNSKGTIRLFRPDCNMKRLKESTKRMALPDFDGNELLNCIDELLKIEERWIPVISEFSLYVRPLHISAEDTLGVSKANKSKLVVMASPVGPYFPTGFSPVSLYCGTETIRSVPKGTGLYKIGGNYAPTISWSEFAKTKGHQQVLWLYGDQIIEAGASNIFFVFKGKDGKKDIVTPQLEDLILPGVTRDSLIELIKTIPQFTISERKITITELLERRAKGELLESFMSGTAVIVGSVKNIEYAGKQYSIDVDPKINAGPVTNELRTKLIDIQEGRSKDPFGWVRIVKE